LQGLNTKAGTVKWNWPVADDGLLSKAAVMRS